MTATTEDYRPPVADSVALPTPYDIVRALFNFPFELRKYQVNEVNRLAESDVRMFDCPGVRGVGTHAGHYDEPGTGKTAIATHHALYRMVRHGVQHWIVLVPSPDLLVPQWTKWLRSITHKGTGKPLRVCDYIGPPKKRRALNLDADFIVMSYELFKQDYERLWDFYEDRRVAGAADEAQKLGNYRSDVHKAFFLFFEGRERQLLTGTPISKPENAYALCRLVAPGVYRNFRHFEQLHVAARDEYEKVIAWQNLDLMAENMKINSSRILRREVRSELPPIQYIPREYDLDPAHLKLYEKLATERLLELEGGGEINAISEGALYSAAQQIIINWGYFADDPSKKPKALELIDEVMDEIGEGKKLAVVAHFIRSNTYLLSQLEKYGAVAIYGEVSARQKQLALTRFMHDPSCRLILLQPSAAGVGVDGLQHVCSEMLVLEAPTVAWLFHQVTARLDRDGQVNPVNCRIAIANKTVQMRMFKNLLNNDELANTVQRGFQDLRAAISGA